MSNLPTSARLTLLRNVGPVAFAALEALTAFADPMGLVTGIATKELAAAVGISRSTFWTALARLEELAVVAREGEGRIRILSLVPSAPPPAPETPRPAPARKEESGARTLLESGSRTPAPKSPESGLTVRNPDSESGSRTPRESPNGGLRVREPDSRVRTADSRVRIPDSARPLPGPLPTTTTTTTTTTLAAAAAAAGCKPQGAREPAAAARELKTNDTTAKAALIAFFKSRTVGPAAFRKLEAAIPGANDAELAEVVRSVTTDAAKKENPARYAHAIFSKPSAVRDRLDEVREKIAADQERAAASERTNEASRKKAAEAAAEKAAEEAFEDFRLALGAKLASYFAKGDVVSVAGDTDGPYKLYENPATKQLMAEAVRQIGKPFALKLPLSTAVVAVMGAEEIARGADQITLARIRELVSKVEAARAAS